VDDLIFLTHRLPFPPDKGDKIRAGRILRHLAARFRVHLGTFIDDPADAPHVSMAENLCASLCCLPLDPRLARLRSLTALGTGGSLSARYFFDARLQDWVDATIAHHHPRHAFVFSSAMAPYLMGHRLGNRILDMVDVDSEKFRQYGEAGGALAPLYRREARTLLSLERRAAAVYDRTLLVSAAEATILTRRAPEIAGRIEVLENGIDLETFDPRIAFANPFAPGRRAAVFTGAMDYRPNVEAVRWFAAAVMPLLRASAPDLDFWIVGARPPRGVRALASQSNIRVTGRVEDVRPYLAHADVAVAPLRIARGVQNKVLEAMAMARPIVASPAALEGLSLIRGDEAIVAATAESFAEAIGGVLAGGAPTMGARARKRAEVDYRWADTLRGFDALFGHADDRAMAVAS
jgi:sugar transferase (PEP-CTERM/EpsH1 system associated)